MCFIANARIKEIFLKSNAFLRCQKRLPMSNHIHQLLSSRHMNKHVNMIWHNQKEVQKPLCFLLVETSRFKDRLRIIRQRRAATSCCGDCNEVNGVRHIDTQRAAAIEALAHR